MTYSAKRESLILSLLGAAVSTAIAWRLGYGWCRSGFDPRWQDPREMTFGYFALQGYSPILPIAACIAGWIALQSRLAWKASLIATAGALVVFWAFAWRVPGAAASIIDDAVDIKGRSLALALSFNAAILGVWYLATHRTKGVRSGRAWLAPLARFAADERAEVSLVVASAATALAFGISFMIYYWRLDELMEFRTAQNSGYFHLGGLAPIAVPLLCVMTGWLGVHTKKWVTAALITFVAGVLLMPTLAWSRTPDNHLAVRGVYELQLSAYYLGVFLNGLFLAVWQLAASEGARALAAASEPSSQPQSGAPGNSLPDGTSTGLGTCPSANRG